MTTTTTAIPTAPALPTGRLRALYVANVLGAGVPDC